MTKYISGMPLWAIILFIAGFLYSIIIIAKPFKQAALNAGMGLKKARTIQYGIFAFYLIYFTYVSILSLQGVFAVYALPPKIIVFAAVPLMLFLFLVVGNTPLFKKLFLHSTPESLIALHIFRLEGVFFILLYFYHLLPAWFAFSGGLGDIITAILALPVAKMLAKGTSWGIKAAYAWNIFGMLDIVNVVIIAIIIAKKSITTGEQGDLEMTIFPFIWLPAFAPPTILFLHTVVFRKLHQVRAK